MTARPIDMRLPVLCLAVALALASGGCAAIAGSEQPRVHVRTAQDSAVRHATDEAAADLILHVSNQSFEDDAVALTVAIDGVTIVDGEFHVEDQHNWITFPLVLPPGEHEITATSDTGAELTESLRTPDNDQQRYAVLDYWYYPDDSMGRHFTWWSSKEPIHFA